MAIFCESDRLTLRVAGPEDAETIARWRATPFLRQMSVGLNTPVTPAWERADIARSQERGEPYLIFQRKPDGAPLGYARVNWVDEYGEIGWLRYGMGRERRQGYCEEGLRAMIGLLFSLGLHRLEAEVFAFNTASVRLLEKLGFTREGVRRKVHFQQGRYWDILIYGMLNGEFPD